MSKTILIVDSDTAAVSQMRAGLERRGFEVQDSADGKGAVELTRKVRPDALVLAVELPLGQNGYILCGKLKKDDDLKAIPVVIVGSPEGFAAHRKLKSRAEEYVAKPAELADLPSRVATLLGVPEVTEPSGEGLDLEELTEAPVEVDDVEAPLQADDALDAAFDDMKSTDGSLTADTGDVLEPIGIVEEQVEEHVDLDLSIAPEPSPDIDEKTPIHQASPFAVDVTKPPPRRPAPSSPPAPSSGAMDASGDLRTLRAKVAELQAALTEAQNQASETQGRVSELEDALRAKDTELDAARSSSAASGKSEKEFFALREAANKKDKELLKLKGELNAKEQELVDLRDREVQLEQQGAVAQGEVSKRDAALKTATARADQLVLEKKKLEQTLTQTKEEARTASSQVTALQAEVEDLRGTSSATSSELEVARAEAGRLTEETERLNQRVAELEAAAAKNEERLSRLYTRLKTEERVREKLRKALGIASQLLDESAAGEVEVDEAAA
jgi:CheY-like chemotaxis protein